MSSSVEVKKSFGVLEENVVWRYEVTWEIPGEPWTEELGEQLIAEIYGWA